MTNFQIKENEGRNKLLQLIKNGKNITNYEFTDQMNHVDCLATGKTGTFAFEIKNRKIPSTQYPNYIMEKVKYDALMQLYQQSGYSPYYITFFTDTTIIWNLCKIDVSDRWKWVNCTSTTAENYCKGEKPKMLMYLYPEEGIIIKNKK